MRKIETGISKTIFLHDIKGIQTHGTRKFWFAEFWTERAQNFPKVKSLMFFLKSLSLLFAWKKPD